MRTRFAPSPTGDLHLGGAYTAFAAFWLARSAGGVTVLRVEDIDRPRVVAGAEERQREDLAWLGLHWDEEPGGRGAVGPYRQSERTALYDAALADLGEQARTYLCDCSRAEIARVASAPHEGEELAYPGTCRDKDPARNMRREPAVRLRLDESDNVEWTDRVTGAAAPRGLHAAGDFVLRRGDGVYAYQLAVSADDLAMGITGVARGDDLLASTPRQLLLMELWRSRGKLPWALGCSPAYWHLPLVRDPDGTRLAKRARARTVRELRDAGVHATEIVGHMAHGLGLVPHPIPMTALDLVKSAPRGTTFRREPWPVPSAWVR